MNLVLDAAVVHAFFRALGFVAVLPIGFDLMGLGKRIGCAVGLGVVLGGGASPSSATIGAGSALTEMALGAFLGVPILFVIGGAALWGELFDAGRGESIGTLHDPSLGGASSTTAFGVQHLAWAYIVFSDTLLEAVGRLFESGRAVPFGEGPTLVALGEGTLAIGRDVLGGALDVALPWAVLFLLVEVALGFVARFAPQVSLQSESFIIKTGVGLWLVWAIDPSDLAAAITQIGPGALDALRR